MLKVGLIGTGFMGRMHTMVYSQLPDAVFVGVWDPNRENAEFHAKQFETKVFDSLEALFEAVDAVDICLPTFLHKEYTVKAANAGKHVLCEKPMAMSEAEAQEMIDAVNANGVRLMIGHCIRFWPEYDKLKKIKDSGELGALKSLNLTRIASFPSYSIENWLANPAKSGGAVLDLHIHDVDFALYLLGHPKNVFASGTVDERGVSHVFSIYDYADGAVAQLEGGWDNGKNTPFRMTFRAVFEQGSVFWDGGPLTMYRNSEGPETLRPDLVSPTFSDTGKGGGNISDLGGYYFEIQHFVDRVLSGEPFDVTTPETAMESLQLALHETALVKAKQG